MSTSVAQVFGIVPAAGRSRRMGAAKQLLEVDGRPMLAAVLTPLAAADVSGLALVTHSGIAQAIDVAAWRGVFVVLNDDETSEMIDSIRLGLAAWSQRADVHERSGFLVCPGDHPGISTADFNACISAFRANPTRIVVATRGGRRGHPLVFPAALAVFVQSAACAGGLNAVVRERADRVTPVELTSPGVTRDVDTAEDYRGLPPRPEGRGSGG